MKIVCMGDSLTEGDYGVKGKSGIANVKSVNYPFFLSKMLNAEVINYGKCGANPLSYLNFLLNNELDLSSTDIVILMLGANGNLGEGNDQGNEAYKKIVEYINVNAKGAKLYILTTPHVTINPMYSNCGYINNVLKANEFIYEFVKENNIPLIDTFKCEYFTEDTEYIMQSNDGLHFSEIGYYSLAKFIRDNLNL